MHSQEEEKYQPGSPRVPADIPPGIIISPDTHREQRIPRGQSRTRKWPVLHYAHVPEVPRERWQLKVFGLVENPVTWNWDEFQSLPRVQVFADFHCVTRWSRLDNIWSGVALAEIFQRVGVKPEAKYLIAHGYDSGWTTNLPLEDALQPDTLVTDLHDGEPLSADHGGPARLMIPQLYAWKSAKWLRGLELVADDRPGYWESVGYHNHGNPWTANADYPDGERFWGP